MQDSWTIHERKDLCITLIESDSTIDYNSGKYHGLPDIRSLLDALFQKFMFLKTKPNSVNVFDPTEPENDEPLLDKEDWSAT